MNSLMQVQLAVSRNCIMKGAYFPYIITSAIYYDATFNGA